MGKCDSLEGGTRPLDFLPDPCYITFVPETPPMYRTLSELRNSINQMIERQGEDAGCAAFVFTKEDVFELEGLDLNQERYFPTLFTQDVLADVGGSSYIYEEIGEMIDDSIRMRKSMSIYSEDVTV